MKKLIFAFCVLILLFASCAKNPVERDARTAEYIENYIDQLKEIEKITSEKFNNVMSLFERITEDPSDELMFQIRDAIAASMDANRKAVEEFRSLALRPKPDFVEDTIQILLVAATALLGQSYEIRTEAQTWLNRYISLGTPRFFREYFEGMENAMQASRQAFFFLTTARVRQKVMAGDTLDMTIEEFLNIPELPDNIEIVLPEEDAAPDETIPVAEEEENADDTGR